MPDIAATMLSLKQRITTSNRNSGRRGLGQRLIRVVAYIAPLLLNVTCLGDFVPPDAPDYEVEAATLAYMVNVGDSIAAPTVTLKKDGQVLTTVGFEATVLTGTDVMVVDSALKKLIVLKTGVATVRVRAVSTSISDTTLYKDFTLTGVVPRIVFGPGVSDTAFSIGDTIQPSATPSMRSGVAIPGPTVAWSVEGSDSAAVLIDPTTGRVRTVKTGSVRLKATTDTATGIRLITVIQRPAKITVSPAGALLGSSGTQAFSASAFDARNVPIPSGAGFTWSSLNTGVATITTGGVASGVSTGQAVIAATSGSVVGYATVTATVPVTTAVNLWAPMNSGTTAKLSAVWGTSAANVYAAGDGGTLLKWSGTSWAQVTSNTTSHLTALWGATPNHVYAVGHNGTVRLWDGTSWTTVTIGNSASLQSVWGATPAAVFIGGANSLSWLSGGAWQLQSVTGNMSGIWGTSSDAVTAVNNSSPMMWTFNGFVWSAGSSLPGTPGNAIRGFAANDIFSVGGGHVRRFDGTNWSISLMPADWRSVWGSAPSDMYVVGGNGTIGRLNQAGVWVSEASGVSAQLNGVWGFGQDVFIVGDGGAILRGYRGATVAVAPTAATLTTVGATQQLTPTARDASAVAVSAATFTWSSSDSAAVTVTADGVATAVGHGIANICAKAPGGVQGCSSVNANTNTVASIDVTPAGVTVTSGTTTLTATARNSVGATVTGVTFAWTSLNPNVATVNASTGVVTPVANGQVTIAATGASVTGYALVTVAMTAPTPVGWFGPMASVATSVGSIWGSAANDIWATGSLNGKIYRLTTAEWTEVATGSNQGFASVWGTSSTDVWAVTSPNSLRWNGTAWSPSPGAPQGFGVWGSSPKDVWIVGGNGQISRFNGTSWASTTPVLTAQALRRVWGTAANNVWAVGENGVILHFNGTAWASVTSGTTSDLFAVWGTAANNVYAAGGNGTGVLLRYNGTNWSPVAMGAAQSLLTSAAFVYGLWGTSASDVYMVGQGIVLRYDGTNWSQVPLEQTGLSPAFGARSMGGAGNSVFIGDDQGRMVRGYRIASVTLAPTSPSIASVGGTQQLTATAKDPANATIAGVPASAFTWTSTNTSVATVNASGLVTAVANGNTSVCATAVGGAQGCVAVFVGSTVTSIVVTPGGASIGSGNTTLSATAKDASNNTVSGVTFTWTSLNTNVATVNSSTGVVTAVSSGQATIAATGGGATGYGLVTVAIAGATPVNLWIPATTPFATRAFGMWGASASSMFVVGTGGFVHGFDGATVTGTSQPLGEQFNGVWGTSAANVFVSGTRRTLARYDGSGWNTINTGSGSDPEFRGIWGSAPNDVFVTTTAGGVQGEIRRYNGTALATMSTGSSGQFWALWGSSATSVFAVGDGGASQGIFHYNGTTWNAVGTLPTAQPLRAVWGTSASDVFAVGASGTVLRHNGTSWALTTTVAEHLSGVWGSSSSDVYAVGATGKILRFNGTSWAAMISGTSYNLTGIWGTSSDVYVTGENGSQSVILRGVRGASITLAPSPVTLSSQGAAQQLTATVKDAANNTLTGATLAWTSSNEGAATVSASGLVTAVANGSTSVCATAPGGVEGCVSVTVGVTIASISMSPIGVSLAGGTTTLTATAKDAGNNIIGNTSLVWSSLRPDIASVNSSTGVVTPVSNGQATIVASAGGVDGFALVTVVMPSAAPVNLWQQKAAAGPGGVTVRDIWAASSTFAVAVSSGGTMTEGIIHSVNGGEWGIADPTNKRLFGVWGSSPNNIYAVGESGLVLRYDGSGWSPVSTGFTGASWFAVWGSSPNDVWIAGTGGDVLRFNGATWTHFSSAQTGMSSEFEAVWGTAANNVYFAGANGYLVRYDGSTWNSIATNTSERFKAIGGTSPSDVYVVGYNGVGRYFNGSVWANESLPLLEAHGIWAVSSNEIIAAGVGNGQNSVAIRAGGVWSSVGGSSFFPQLYAVDGVPGGGVWAGGTTGSPTVYRGLRGATVVLSPASPNLFSIGATQQLTATAKDASNNAISGVTFTWSSATPSVATVNSTTGEVTAVANGTSSVCAMAPGGVQGCTTVTVAQATSSLSFSPSSWHIGIIGDTRTMNVEARDANNNVITGRTFTWTSLNTAVATVVPATGVVTTVSDGQAVVRVTTDDNVIGYVLINSNTNSPAAAPNLWASVATGFGEVALDVWGADASNIFAVNGGRVLRYNGTSWTVIHTLGSGGLNGLWGTSSTDVFAVGSGGTILHFNGSAWSTMTSPTTKDLNQVWGSAPNDVFAVGSEGTIVHYNGTAWSLMSSSTTADLADVYGSGRSNAHAVGAGGVLLRWTGANWTQVNAGLTSEGLHAVWSPGGNINVLAGGDNGAALRYDGLTWLSEPTSFTGNALSAVWGAGSNDVYAVGLGTRPILRYNGNTWSQASYEPVSTTYLFGLWGTSTSDVWASGANPSGLLLRGVRGATVTVGPVAPTIATLGATQQMTPTAKDASNSTIAGVTYTWSSATPGTATVNSSGLVTAVASGTSSVCATAPGGAQGCTTVTVSTTLASISVTPEGATISGGNTTFTATAKDAGGNTISGVTFTWSSLNQNVATVNSSGVVTAVASGQATIAATAGAFTGYGVVTVAMPGATPVNIWATMSSGTTNTLWRVWGASANDVFAVGVGGTILRYNGSAWGPMTSGTSVQISGLWGTSASNVFAVGAGGTILRYDGSLWNPMTSGTTNNLLGVWGTSSVDVFAVGAAGEIRRFDGTSWNPMSSGTSESLNTPWGTGTGGIWATGNAGTVLHFNGTSWGPQASNTGQNLVDIWGWGPDVFAVGGHSAGTILRSPAVAWSSMTHGATGSVRGIWGSSASDLYAVGNDGVVLRHNGSAWLIDTVPGVALISVWGRSNGDVFAVGETGVIVRGVRGGSVTVTPSTPTVAALGATQQMTATAKDASNNTVNGVTFRWSSATPSVATVNSSGLVTAVANGTTNVCATAPGGAQGCTTITVDQAVASITMGGDGTMVTGNGSPFTATGLDFNSNVISGQVFAWASLNPDVATVNASTGLVTVVRSGQATISVSADGTTRYVLLNVALPATAVNVWGTMTSPTSLPLYGVWGSSGSDVFAVGSNGEIHHYNGTAWSPMTTGTVQVLFGVWGTSSSNVFAVGANGTILRYNGTNWVDMSIGGNTLRGVWGTGPNDVWAVGNAGTIFRFDGNSWTAVNSSTGQVLSGIWGSSHTNVYAVGNTGTIVHWDGNNWGPQTSTVGTNLFGTWSGGTDLFTVGSGSTILRSTNGTSWAGMTHGATSDVLSVWGSNVSDVYAVSAGEILRFNGSTWSMDTVPGAALIGLWGRSNGDVFAVGNNGAIVRGVRGGSVLVTPSSPTITSLGATQQMTATAKDASNNTVTGVSFDWASSQPGVATVNASGLVTAVSNGSTNVCATAVGGAQHCSTVTVAQAAASILVTPGGASLSGGTTALSANAKDANNNTISGATFTWTSLNTSIATVNSSGVVTAVTSGQATVSATADGKVGYAVITVAISGATPVNLWVSENSGITTHLRDVWGPSSSDLFAVGDAGVVRRNTGSGWVSSPTSVGANFSGIWGSSSNSVFAGAEGVTGPRAMYFNGSTWVASPTSDENLSMYDVWSASPSEVYATTQNNSIHKFDGQSWTTIASSAPGGLLQIWGTSSSDIWAAGGNGTIVHWDGSQWTTITTGVWSATFHGIWGTAPNNVYFLGNSVALRWNGSSLESITDVTLVGANLSGVWGTSANDLYATTFTSGGYVRTFRYNGTAWSLNDEVAAVVGQDPDALAIWGVGNGGSVVTVGRIGTIRRGYRGATVTVTPATPTITTIGTYQQLSATAKDASNNTVSGVTFTWSSVSPSIATVDGTGNVTAVAQGTTSVCATAPGGAQGCTTVTVDQLAASVAVSPLGASLTSGTTTLTATAMDAGPTTITGQTFTWTSLNTGIATVNSSGVVTAVSSGQAHIAATADGVSGYAVVTVAAPSATPVNLWVPVTSPTGQDLYSVWAADANNVFAVGGQGVVARYNGTAWSRIDSGAASTMYQVTGTSASDVVASGSSQVRRFNGSSWTSQTLVGATGVWMAAPNELYVGSQAGGAFPYHLVRIRGAVFDTIGTGPFPPYAWLVWGSASNNVMFAMSQGQINKWNGTTMSGQTVGSSNINGIWGASASELFAVRHQAAPIRSTNGGSSWESLSSPGGLCCVAIWGTSTTEVFASFQNSDTIARYNGSTWTKASHGSGSQINGLGGMSNGDAWAVGNGGKIVRGVRGATVTVTPTTPTITSLGNTQQITPTAKDASNNTISGVTFTWSSSDETKATVSLSGLVTAVANGTSSVCATAPGGAQGCTTVTVDQTAASITVTPGGATLTGGTTSFTGTAKDANNNTISGQAFTWTSLNTGIATVNGSGVVTAVSSGQATIRATADGINAYALATVAIAGATPVNLWASDVSGTMSSLSAVWGAGPSEIYATGQSGVVRRYNGTSWATSTTSINTTLASVWGPGSNDVFAGGAGSTTDKAIRFNGTSWSVSLPSAVPDINALWGVSPVEVYGAASEHSVYKFDGTTWTPIDVPGNSGSTYYTDIWGSSSSNIWMVGTSGTVKRWNGTQWNDVNSVAGVQGVWGTGPTEAFVVGDAGKAFRHDGVSYTDISSGLTSAHYPRALWGSSGSDLYAAGADGKIFRYNGSTWAVTDSSVSTTYEGVWGTSAGDVIVVGGQGWIRRGYRGATVTVAPSSPALGAAGVTQQMTATAKDAGNNTISTATVTWTSATPSVATVSASGLVTAVAQGTSSVCATAPGGAQGCTTVEVLSPLSVAVTPSAGATISGVGSTTTMTGDARDSGNQQISGATFAWASLNTSVATVNPSTGVVTAVSSGQATISATNSGLTAYGVVTVEVPTATPVNLWASMSSVMQPISIWGSSSSNIFGVGSGGGIVLYDGNSWGSLTSGTSEYLDGVAGTSGSDVWAVGSNGTIRRFNGSAWSTSTSNSSADLNDVWAAAPNDVYAVGENGTILHFDGSSWSAMTSNSSATLMRIWGAGRSAIYAVGLGGEILKYDGSAWSAMTSGTSADLWAVWGTSATNVFAVGFGGAIRRYNGTSWSGMTSGTTEPLIGLWGSSSSDVYATGSPSGLALRFNGTSWSTSCAGCGSGQTRVWGTSASNVWVGASLPSNSVLRGYRGASVTVTPASPTIGGAQQMTGTSKDASNNTISGVTLTWTSSDANVATVDASSGLVTAVADGTTSVCATAYGGAQGCTTVTVAGVSLAAAHGSTSVSNNNIVLLTGMNVSGTNRLLVCVLALLPYASTPTVTNIRYDNNGGTLVNPVQLGGSYFGPTGGYKYSTYYVIAPATASSGFVQVTLSGNASLAHLSCVTYKGVHQTTPFGAATTASGSSGSASIARTSGFAGSLPFGVLTAISDYTSDVGVTERQSVYETGYAYMVDGNTKIASGNSHTFNWLYSSEFAGQAVMIRPANP